VGGGHCFRSLAAHTGTLLPIPYFGNDEQKAKYLPGSHHRWQPDGAHRLTELRLGLTRWVPKPRLF
jgi:alkylation response protein AidB-like acyl-CoA dehydrogenase